MVHIAPNTASSAAPTAADVHLVQSSLAHSSGVCERGVRQGGGSLATVSAGYTWHWAEFELADELVDVVDGRGMRV